MRDPAGDACALPQGGRSLALTLADPAALRAEYARNLHKGGAFVPTRDRFEMREMVEVTLHLQFCGMTLRYPAEVVLSLPADVAPPGAEPGVAVQLLADVDELRERLEPFLDAAHVRPLPAPERDRAAARRVTLGPESDELLDLGLPGDTDCGEDLDPEFSLLEPLELDTPVEGPPPAPVAAPAPHAQRKPQERRDSPREIARILVQVRTATGIELEARTRDLSRSGVLLTVEGAELPVGRRMGLRFTHPVRGDSLEVEGCVVRHLEGEGTVPAVAIRFEPALGRAAEVTRFIEDLQQLEETRRREGIRGPIEEMGVASLIQMFASCGPRGTVTLARGTEEGTVAFEHGRLVAAELGPVTGPKALARLLTWNDGEFEFRNHVDPPSGDQPTPSLEAALLDALRRLDEEKRLGLPELALDARLAVDHERLRSVETPLTQVEEAVVELAAAAFTVRRILDVIPEADAEIRAAITSLKKRAVLRGRD